MIGYISIGSYRIKGDDWQSDPLKGSFQPYPSKISLNNPCLSHYEFG